MQIKEDQVFIIILKQILFSKDKSLPYSNKTISLVIKATKMFLYTSIIGWDITYTPDGLAVIEGNTVPCSVQLQISLRGLKNNKIYDHIYRDSHN